MPPWLMRMLPVPACPPPSAKFVQRFDEKVVQISQQVELLQTKTDAEDAAHEV